VDLYRGSRAFLPAAAPGWQPETFRFGPRGFEVGNILHCWCCFWDELRYWLYDGDIFTTNTVWLKPHLNHPCCGARFSGSYCLSRAKSAIVGVALTEYFRWVLLGALWAFSYFTTVTLHTMVEQQHYQRYRPIFNMLLPASVARCFWPLAL